MQRNTIKQQMLANLRTQSARQQRPGKSDAVATPPAPRSRTVTLYM